MEVEKQRTVSDVVTNTPNWCYPERSDTAEVVVVVGTAVAVAAVG